MGSEMCIRDRGDAEALEELIGRYYPEILKYCLWHAPNRSLAEDAVQETFLKAIRYMDKYVHRGKFRAYLYKIAANTGIDMRRRKWAEETYLEDLAEEVSYEESGYEQADEDVLLRNLVRNLKQEQQETVILRFGQGLTMREIAEVMGIPVRTVQSRLRAAMKQIRTELEEG